MSATLPEVETASPPKDGAELLVSLPVISEPSMRTPVVGIADALSTLARSASEGFKELSRDPSLAHRASVGTSLLERLLGEQQQLTAVDLFGFFGVASFLVVMYAGAKRVLSARTDPAADSPPDTAPVPTIS